MYLLDTPVITELRLTHTGKADPGVIAWAGNVARQNMYMSALSLLELESGVARLAARDKPQSDILRRWIDDQVMAAFEGHILAVDSAVIRRRAALPFSDGKNTGADRDALMTATALVHGLTLVTRHASNFRTGRVKVFSPWGYTADSQPTLDDEADWQQGTRSGPVWLKNLFLRF